MRKMILTMCSTTSMMGNTNSWMPVNWWQRLTNCFKMSARARRF
uniref:Alternative protein PCDH18 n=1 Tax=Homo sapiens TaxID=9606 RepID=L8ECI2_HUMAN|nr:alternative protein PCDH18 [Homo sapiens]